MADHAKRTAPDWGPREMADFHRVAEASRIQAFEARSGRKWNDKEAERIVDAALARLEATDDDAWRMLL